MHVRARQTVWGLVAVAGYILSPLSPWNDAFVNVPIAYAAARLLALLGVPKALGFYLGYMLSNVAGLVMLQLGIRGVRGHVAGSRELARSIAASSAYSVAVYMFLSLLGLL